MNRLLLIILLSLFSISCTQKVMQPFSFVQMCDTQLGMGGYEQDIQAFKQAVKQINILKPDFVIICGDLVDIADDSSFSDFLKIKESFTVPCYCAAGNHDVENIPNDTTLSYYRNAIGKDYYEFRHKGYSFIVTNSQLWKVNLYDESKKHDDWFKNTLQSQSTKKNPVFVIGHYPLFIENHLEEEGYFNFPPIKRAEILELFTQNNVLAYLSGHKHELVINNFENIQLVSGETTSLNFDNRPYGFRLWKVSSDTVKHQLVPLEHKIVKQINPDYN